MFKAMRPMTLAVVGVALGMAEAAMAQQSFTVTLSASADNTMFSELPNNSNGQGPGIFAGTLATGDFRRALLKFDVSSIPAHAPITSATLTLHMNLTIAGAFPFTANRLLEDWGEGASNAGLPGGQGTAAAPGDATWTYAFYNTVFWSTPGGVFDGTVSATTNVGGTGDYSWSSEDLRVDVQRWVDSTADNFGWVIRGPETTDTSAKRFDSAESSTVANRPRLVVEYLCPADFDQNGFVNGDDFDLFSSLFDAGDPGADWDRNGFVNGDDFDGFAQAFDAGC